MALPGRSGDDSQRSFLLSQRASAISFGWVCLFPLVSLTAPIATLVLYSFLPSLNLRASGGLPVCAWRSLAWALAAL